MEGIQELMSELIPLAIVLVVIYEGTRGDEAGRAWMQELKTTLIAFSIIEIPALLVTVFCMITHNPKSRLLHFITIIGFTAAAIVYILYARKKRNH